MDLFDKLNAETRDYNNGITRNISWYDLTTNNGASWRSNNTKKGYYTGSGKYIEY